MKMITVQAIDAHNYVTVYAITQYRGERVNATKPIGHIEKEKVNARFNECNIPGAVVGPLSPMLASGASFALDVMTRGEIVRKVVAIPVLHLTED